MVIDTSAVLAILLREAESLAGAIERADTIWMSAASYLEAALVIDNRGDAVASRQFDHFEEGEHQGRSRNFRTGKASSRGAP